MKTKLVSTETGKQISEEALVGSVHFGFWVSLPKNSKIKFPDMFKTSGWYRIDEIALDYETADKVGVAVLSVTLLDDE